MSTGGILLLAATFALPVGILIWFFHNHFRERRQSERIGAFVSRLAPADARKLHDIVSEAACAHALEQREKQLFIELLYVLRGHAVGDGLGSGPRALLGGVGIVAAEIHGNAPPFRFGDAMTDVETSRIDGFVTELLALCSNRRFESDAMSSARRASARAPQPER